MRTEELPLATESELQVALRDPYEMVAFRPEYVLLSLMMETEYVTADQARVGRVEPGQCKVVTNHGKPYAVIFAWEDYEPVHSLIDLYRQSPPSELRLSGSDLAAHAVTESAELDTEEDLSQLREFLAS